MKFYSEDYKPRSPLHIPGDVPFLDKDDPLQDHFRAKRAEAQGIPARDRYNHDDYPYLTDDEWDQIKIEPEDMRSYPEWDGACGGACCEVVWEPFI